MPKITLQLDENTIPTDAKAFATADHKLTVWVGSDDAQVAAETNPGLVKNRDDLKVEKETWKTKHDSLLAVTSTEDAAKAKLLADAEARAKNSMPAEDLAIVAAVKEVLPNAKAEDVKKTLTDYPALETKVKTFEQQTENEKIFNASGYKNKTVFAKVLSDPELNPNFDSVVWKDEKDSKDQPVKVPYVKLKNAVDGKVEVSLADYAKANTEWTPFMPALEADGNGNGGGSQWLPQGASGGGNGGAKTSGSGGNSVLDSVIDADNKRSEAVASPFAAVKSAEATQN